MTDEPDLTTPVIGILRILQGTDSIELHHQRLDDVAAACGGPGSMDRYKRQFEQMVKTAMKKTGCDEATACKTICTYMYGKVLARAPEDGQTGRA